MIELRCELWHSRYPLRPGGDHDVIRLEPLVAGVEHVPAVVLVERVDPHSSPYGNGEVPGVLLEVVSHLVLGRG